MQTDDGRHAKRTREDRRVVRAASRVGRKSLDARPIELRDDRRRQFVGDEHARGVEVLQPVTGAALVVAKVHPQATGDIVQVAFALVQIRIVNVVEDGGGLVERALHRPFGVDPFVAHDRGRASDQDRIVEHQQLGVEDRRKIGASCRRDPPANLFELSCATVGGPARARRAHAPRRQDRRENAVPASAELRPAPGPLPRPVTRRYRSGVPRFLTKSRFDELDQRVDGACPRPALPR